MECRSVCLLLCVAVLYISPLCTALALEECGPSEIAGSFSKIVLEGCVDGNADVCELKRGSNSSATFYFKSSKKTSMVKGEAIGVMGKLEQSIPLVGPDLCSDVNGGLTCPLNPDVEYTYQIHMPIMKNYPKVRCQIRWEFKNDDDEFIFCILVPIKIVKGDDE